MKKVTISTSGHQKDLSGSMEKISHVTEGQYYFRNNKHYIKYNDDSVDKENVLRTTIKTDGQSLNIFRRGALDTDMTFVMGKTTHTMYRTPYSAMELEICTKDLSICMNEACGEVDLLYDMAVNGSVVGEYKLHLEIREI